MIGILPILVVASNVYYPWRDGFAESFAKLSNVQAIVKIKELKPISEREAYLGNILSPNKLRIRLVEATCLDGKGIEATHTVRIAVTVAKDGDSLQGVQEPKKDSNYLLIGMKPFQNKLVFTFGNPLIKEHLYVDLNDPSEISALMMIPTKKEQLASGKSNLEVITRSAIDCLSEASDEDFLRICRFLKDARPGRETRPSRASYLQEPVVYCPETVETKRLSELSQSVTSFKRWLVDGLLVRWRVLGATSRYRDSLAALSLDRKYFAKELERRELIWDLDKYAEVDGSQGFETAEKWIDALLLCQNDLLTAYFIEFYAMSMNEAQMGRFARLLNHRSIKVRYWAARTLALLTGDTKNDPKLYGTDSNSHHVDFPDLEGKLTYWRNRFGIRPPN